MSEFLPAAPMLLVLVGATIGVVLEGAIPRLMRSTVQAAWTVLVLLAAIGWTLVNWTSVPLGIYALGSLSLDGPSWLSWLLLLVFALMATLLFAERRVGGGESPFAASVSAVPSSQSEREAIAARQEHSEVFPLLLYSVGGMMAFVSATDLLTLFIALEVFSFPLYILTGMARRRRLLSQEASLKYFLLGALSSGIFLYGIAMLYGYSGAFHFDAIDAAIQAGGQSQGLLLAGIALVAVGLLFKIGAVPFHNWVPDVYVGSPTPVTAFMAICTKMAATVGMLRLLYVALGAMRWDWQAALAVIAVLTMLIGSLVGLMQSDVKRVLAYSSVAHGGFILVAVVGAVTVESGLAEGRVGSVSAALFYLAAYGFATLGAFAILTLVRRSGAEATSYAAWAGLGRRNPLLGGLMTFFLLSMAGIPLTGGFIGKVLVFVAGWTGGFGWLVVVAVVASLIAAGFYFRVIWVIFGQAPNTETAVVSPGMGTFAVIWIGAIGTLLLGVLPGPLMDVAGAAAGFLR
ncbi:MAG: NADH-quinone oxidoreductase subunit NuoN [Brooklawnia sp.]|jgi:NADH-quinone oxidoreductase subunit N